MCQTVLGPGDKQRLPIDETSKSATEEAGE